MQNMTDFFEHLAYCPSIACSVPFHRLGEHKNISAPEALRHSGAERDMLGSLDGSAMLA